MTTPALGGDVRAASHVPDASNAAEPAGTSDVRAYWSGLAGRLATPLLPALAELRLKATMPVESHPRSDDRALYTHLEGVARLLAGLGPWLELGDDGGSEGSERERLAALARDGIDAATDSVSPDYLNFSNGRQPLVDAAFLAQGILRAPTQLWDRLEPRVQRNVVAALSASRAIRPRENNWQLFASCVEAFLHRAGERRDDTRLFDGLERYRAWYLGDGVYGDGAELQFDYYNAYVIHPMLLETLDVVGGESAELRSFRASVRDRLTRFAAIQERMIAPDGSFAVVGRSIAYRAGAFQGLALAALRGLLPEDIPPAQARVALTAVLRRTMDAPGTFDAAGWLRIGLAGHQPALGEKYVSTGSLYVCSCALLPLGLPASNPFWMDLPVPTTWQKAWSGEDLPFDRSLQEVEV